MKRRKKSSLNDKKRTAKGESKRRKRRRRREARHGVSNKASNLTAGGERFPAALVASCSSGVHGTRGRTDRFDVSKY